MKDTGIETPADPTDRSAGVPAAEGTGGGDVGSAVSPVKAIPAVSDRTRAKTTASAKRVDDAL